jgi:hypothetical protein
MQFDSLQKQPNLKLKTRPKQLLGYLPLTWCSPVSHMTLDLQRRLGGGEHLRQLPKLNIDPITNTTLHALHKIELKYYSLMDTDVTLHNKFLHTKVKHAIADNRHNSIEHNALRLRLRRLITFTAGAGVRPVRLRPQQRLRRARLLLRRRLHLLGGV